MYTVNTWKVRLGNLSQKSISLSKRNIIPYMKLYMPLVSAVRLKVEEGCAEGGGRYCGETIESSRRRF
jgi:hypothetical protein